MLLVQVRGPLRPVLPRTAGRVLIGHGEILSDPVGGVPIIDESVALSTEKKELENIHVFR